MLEPGRTYTIGVNAADEPPTENIGATVKPCEDDSEGTRDVSVRIRDEGHGVIPWSCDEEYTERELKYEDPEEYRVEPPEDEETWTSPTPGASGDSQNR